MHLLPVPALDGAHRQRAIGVQTILLEREKIKRTTMKLRRFQQVT